MKKVILCISLSILITACSFENDQAKGEYLSGCMRSGGTKDECNCLFDSLKETFNLKSGNDLAIYAQQSPQEFTEATRNTVRFCQTSLGK